MRVDFNLGTNVNGAIKSIKFEKENSAQQNPSFKAVKHDKVMMMIYDGFGIAPKLTKNNPFKDAKMPIYKGLKANINGDTIFRTIEAAGVHVGLPAGMVGSSEVGHNNLGAGRLVPQDLMMIDNALNDGSFYSNKTILEAMKNAKQTGKTIHVMGLLSDGGVHSETRHLNAIIKMAHDLGVNDIKVHAFLDGRDVKEGTGIDYVHQTNQVLAENGFSEIASIMGMTLPMDRAKNWEKTSEAFDLLTHGRNYPEVTDIYAELNRQYHNGVEDRNIMPRKTTSYKPISDGDTVIFFNYRPDRAIQITDALTQKNCVAPFLNGKRQPQNLNFVCMSQYKPEFHLPVAFAPEMHRNTLTQIMSENLYRPFICTETEKQAHLTFFFDGKRHINFDGVSSVFLASEKKFTPPMRLGQIKEYLKLALKDNTTKFILTNFANPDMIGHNGTYEDAVKALEYVDKVTGELLKLARKLGVAVVGTCDHGNIEDMSQGGHTNNPVPLFTVLPGTEKEIANKEIRFTNDKTMALKDVAPTVLDIVGVKKPYDMSGESVLDRKKIY